MRPITFSGEITKEIEVEFRNLYYERPLLYPVVYSLGGLLMFMLAVFTLSSIGERIDNTYGLIFIVFATLLFILAFRLQHIWWRWWWPKFLNAFGKRLDGEVSETGIRFKTEGTIVNWKYFEGVKQSHSLVLIYFDRVSAYPIHQSMISNSSEWQELLVLTQKCIRRRLI